MNIQDRKKTLTVEDLRRRYNLDSLDKDRKAIKLNKAQLKKFDSELNDFVKATTKNIDDIKNQVDGNIATWFFDGIPTLENEPAKDWITVDDKNNHLGDLYYDKETGSAYRFICEKDAYSWIRLNDSDITKALAIANAAKDTADSKRRVFVVTPISPYDVGDIWIKDDEELYRCRASRESGSMNVADWVKATKYTDDAVALGVKAELDQFKTTVEEGYVSNATLETTVNSINGKVEETYTYITTVENQMEDITATAQTLTGNNYLYIEDATEMDALEYVVEGKCEQETSLQNRNIAYLDSRNLVYTISQAEYRLNGYNEIEIIGKPTKTWDSFSFKIFPKETGKYTFHYKLSSKSDNLTRCFMNVAKFNKSGSRLSVLDVSSKIVGASYSGTFNIDDISDECYYTIGCYLSSDENNSPFDEDSSVMYSEIYLAKEDSFSSYIPFVPDKPSPLFTSKIQTINDLKIKISNLKTEVETDQEEVLNEHSILIDLNNNELCSVNDVKDLFLIKNGQTTIEKKIGKIILNGSENWSYYDDYFYITGSDYKKNEDGGKCISSHYPYSSDTKNSIFIGDLNFIIIRDSRFSNVTDFTNYLKEQHDSDNPVTVFYELNDPQKIILETTSLALFENINRIELLNSIETGTSIKYLRNTPLSKEYATQYELNETNSNLSNVDNKTEQNADAINNTNINIHNNYYNKNQIDQMNTSTEQIITQIRNQVETTTTATNFQIGILQEQLKNGITSVKTETGYTFDKDGLKIAKSGSEMKAIFDNDGLAVYRNNTEVLTVRSNGVETENLKVRTYLNIGKNTRVEDYKEGTGFFYVGGGS